MQLLFVCGDLGPIKTFILSLALSACFKLDENTQRKILHGLVIKNVCACIKCYVCTVLSVH